MNKPNNKKRINFGDDYAIQKWSTFVRGGESYDLSHLDVSLVKYEIESKSYEFYVTYSHHCFAKTVVGFNDCESWLYPFDKDPRHFHKERYRLSFGLPRIIQALPTSNTYHGRAGSYAVCEITNSFGQQVFYQVVFKVYRASKKYRIHVMSAFPIDERPSPRKVRFSVIVRALASGKELPKPQK